MLISGTRVIAMDEDAVEEGEVALEVGVEVAEAEIALEVEVVEVETALDEVAGEVEIAMDAVAVVVAAETATVVEVAEVDMVAAETAAVAAAVTEIAAVPVMTMNGVVDTRRHPKRTTDMVQEEAMINTVSSSEMKPVLVVARGGEVDGKLNDANEFVLSLLHTFVYKSHKKNIVK